MAVSFFKNQLKEGSNSSGEKLGAGSSLSLTSLETADSAHQFKEFEKHCSRVGCIIKPAAKFGFQSGVGNSAGLLITAQKKHSSAVELRQRRNSCTEFSTQPPSATYVFFSSI